MIFSAQQQFSNAQAITADAISENVIDLGVRGTPYGAAAALNGDIGKGAKIPILVQVVEAFNTLTSLTITIESDSAVGLDGSPVVAYTETIPLAGLTVGRKIAIDVLPNTITGRYLGIRYNVNGTNPTLGKITAGIVAGVQTNETGA